MILAQARTVPSQLKFVIFLITNRGIVTIQTCLRNYAFQSRVYFDFEKKLKYKELKKVIHPVKGLEYKGAGIRCHSSIIGKIMNFFKLATKINVDGKIFYLNNKSLCRYVIRKCETHKILKNFQETDNIARFEEVVLRLNDLYLRSLGTKQSDPQIKTIMSVLKATVRAGAIKDTDKFEDLIITLQEVAEKTEAQEV